MYDWMTTSYLKPLSLQRGWVFTWTQVSVLVGERREVKWDILASISQDPKEFSRGMQNHPLEDYHKKPTLKCQEGKIVIFVFVTIY